MNRPLRTFAFAAVAAALASLTSAPSRAASVLGVTLLGNQLISVDTSTGNGTLVGPLSSTMTPFGLATVNNQLFTYDSAASRLRQLNPTTGATLATFNVGNLAVLGQGGMAFQSSTVGFLSSAINPSTFAASNNLYRFDTSSGGSSALVGTTSVPMEGLAFGNGTLFGLGKLNGNLYSINPTSAATTLIGSTGVSVGSPTGGLTFSGGLLYATLDDKLYTLNPTTGVATPVGTADPDSDTGFSSISGLAFAPVVAAVPEPASFVMLGLGTGAVGLYALRRRHPSKAAADRSGETRA